MIDIEAVGETDLDRKDNTNWCLSNNYILLPTNKNACVAKKSCEKKIMHNNIKCITKQ